jgi:hypothetical protein
MKSAKEWAWDNDGAFIQRLDGNQVIDLFAKVQADARAPLEAVLRDVLVDYRERIVARQVYNHGVEDLTPMLAKVEAALKEAM